jgi:glycosyltransferase involved in cell wall biosynthesis
VKILHLTGDREDYGGITSVLRNLQVATARLGWEHVVWVNEAYVEKRQPALSYRRSRHALGESASHPRLVWQALLAVGELRRLLRQERFDVIHAHSRGMLLVGLAAAKFWGPVVFTNHNYARRLGLYRWAAGQRNLYTVLLTPNMAKYYGLEVQPPRVSVISSCCADWLFDEPLIQRPEPEERPTLRLVGVGTITRWKRWHLVLRALMQLAETERNRVEFSLWGPTPDDPEARRYEAELKESIKRNGLERQVVLRGSMTSLTEALRAADWMVHPATNEPCGVALIEAMALGMPAVVSKSGGPADIVQGGRTGLLFEPDDPKALADQLRRILRNRVTLAGPADIRESVRHRSASGVVKEYQALYGGLGAAP